ncbi:DUF2474 domain-containing protein [Alloalcanivorax sp. C16-2]|nr:DUF2474 domain-containing protein [Alloalcanivorax marinus]MBL7250035.1 DUF2474 domain-containing protein [Alloalcanivorax marinus]
MRQPTSTPPPSRLRRLGWLLLIWSASVLTLALAAGAMRLLMNAIGLQTT